MLQPTPLPHSPPSLRSLPNSVMLLLRLLLASQWPTASLPSKASLQPAPPLAAAASSEYSSSPSPCRDSLRHSASTVHAACCRACKVVPTHVCSEAHGAWRMAHGARRMAHSARRTAHGARRTAHGARRTAHGAWRTAHGARRMAHGARRMAHGARRTAHGAWRTAHGAWRMAHSAWRTALGAWRTAHGARRTAHGARRMARGTWRRGSDAATCNPWGELHLQAAMGRLR
eukprot:366565-Chlamydomonas_euryale.AAC.12